MKGGFSFCGVDIEDIGLNYAPEIKDTYVYSPGVENVHEETYEGHNGGYTYGAYKEPKEFILRCYFEETHIAKGIMAKFHALFKVGKSGLLVFQRRPWCYYYATVTNVNTDELSNYLNGLLVITMKAYYPYARSVPVNGKMFSNTVMDRYHEEIMQNTGLLDNDSFVPPMAFGSSGSPITSQKSIILYNPGTERAKVDIVISGTAGDGVIIANKTTEQKCRYVAFQTTEPDYIYTDSINGKTVIDRSGERNLAFLYHDYGFIELEPSFPILRNILVDYNGTTVTTQKILFDNDFQKEWYEDRYIYLDNWYKILRCENKHTITVLPRDGQVPGQGKTKTNIVLMNEITITPSQGTSLTKLNFVYKPTFA